MRYTTFGPITALVCAGTAPAFGQASFRTIPPDKGFDYTVVQDVSADGTKVLVSLQNSHQAADDPLFVCAHPRG